MSKMLKFNEKALDAMLRGVKSLAKAVIVTLGPKGRNVVIKKDYGVPVSTKDGVTVAKEIVLKDKFENMGAQLIKEASAKTSDVAGDGTTTAIVLAQEIFTEGVKNVIAGANPMDIKKGIDKSVALIIEELSRLSKPVTTPEEIKQIATISANNDEEIGQMIANAMEKVGKDGIISVSEAKGIETELDVVEGMQFDKGYVSPYFITNAEKMIVEYDNAQIFITDKKLSSARDIVPILEKIATAGSKPLLIIAEDIDSEALATLVVNKIKGGMAICAVKAPAFGDRRKEILQDIGILTGATVVSEDVGMKLEDIDLDVLGSAKKIKITKDDTTIIDGEGELDQIKKRITQIKQEMNVSTSDYDREKLEERLAKLVGGVAVINVGAPTEAEMKERKARVEDALHATRAATADGIVPGGGVALLRALTVLEKLDLKGDENIGKEIVKKACYAPSIAIANNCGMQGNLIAEKILEKKGSFGFNGLTGEFSDLVKDGVVDPAFVTKSALVNAASISGLLITAAVMITDKPEPKGSSPSMDPSMMGGMGGMGMPGMGMGGMPGMM